MTEFPKLLESIDDLTSQQIHSLISLAFHLKSSPSLGPPERNGSVLAAFFENSTRTKYSFLKAAWQLGLQGSDFPVEKSSLAKGESFGETLKALYHQGHGALVVRTPDENFFRPFRESPPLPLINAGNGMAEHPTQALVDLMTFQELMSSPQEKTFCLVGDIKHSRVAHSLTKLWAKMGIPFMTAGPRDWRDDSLDVPHALDIHEAIEGSDALYLLRIQLERHSGPPMNSEALAQYIQDFGVTASKLAAHKKCPLIFHPGPVQKGVELDGEAMNSQAYRGYDQVRNSTWLRASLLAHMIPEVRHGPWPL